MPSDCNRKMHTYVLVGRERALADRAYSNIAEGRVNFATPQRRFVAEKPRRSRSRECNASRSIALLNFDLNSCDASARLCRPIDSTRTNFALSRCAALFFFRKTFTSPGTYNHIPYLSDSAERRAPRVPLSLYFSVIHCIQYVICIPVQQHSRSY